MTQEANKNEKSKVPFLEDALDNLDAPQVDSSDLDENSIGDDLDTLDLGGGDLDYDDDSILLDGSKVDAENNLDLDSLSSPSSTNGEDDINFTIDDELSLPVDDSATPSLPTQDEDSLDLEVDELGLPVEIDDALTQGLPVEDEDTLELGEDELGLPVEIDDALTQELPVEDEDTSDLGEDELGLPVENGDTATQELPVEDEDTLDLGVDELGLPVENGDTATQELPVEDEDTSDLGEDELGLPVENGDTATQALPVEDEDVLDLGVDELGLPVESDETTTQELPVEDEDTLDLGVDELGLPVESDDLGLDDEDAGLPAEEDTSNLDDDFGSPELPSSELDDSDELDLIMGDNSGDSSLVTDDESAQSPEIDDSENNVEDDLDGGFDLLMGEDDNDSESNTDSSQPAVEDDFDLMMNSDDQSNDDPISNWEQEDDDELDEDDDDLLDGFMPDEGSDINQPLDDEQNDVDAGVADMLDNFAPTMSKDEDVDDFLNDIESKNGGAISEEEEDFLPEIKNEVEKEDPKPTIDTPSSDKKESADEDQEVKEHDDKKTGFLGKLARIGLSVALACGVGFGALYVNENGIPKEVSEIVPSAFSISNDVEVQSSVMKEIEALRSQVETLSSEVKKVKSNAEFNLTEYKKLVLLQSELNKSHSEQVGIINSIKSSAKKYEGEMISRLEKLALYVKSVETGNNEKQAVMRESLYKELVAYIKANASNDDAGKLTELAENLRKQSVKTAQLDAALQAQRRVVSIIEDEQNYIRGTVDSIRESRSAPSVNLLKSDNDKPSVKSTSGAQIESEKTDEVCCVFVEEKQQKQVSSNVEKDEYKAKYRLVSVIKRGPRSWDIYLEPSAEKGRMSVEKYTLTPTGASSVPGYGRITGVVELKDGNARIPYKVITDNGVLVSRKKG
jgi:hypothetical protein